MSNLSTLRADRGLSQAALAKLAGVSATLISKLEHRTKEPKGLRTAFALAEALHCAVSDIWPSVEPVVARQLPKRLPKPQVAETPGTKRNRARTSVESGLKSKD